MTRCAYKDSECVETDDCDSLFVSCDDCEFIDTEGYCDNKRGSRYPNFVDGLAVCCKCFLYKKTNS